jgi:hypothetical protein
MQSTADIAGYMVPRRLLFRKNHPKHCPTSMKELIPFNKSQIVTLSFQLSTFTFPCFGGIICFLEGRFSQGNSKLHSTDNYVGVTEPLSASTKLQDLKFLFLKFLLNF